MELTRSSLAKVCQSKWRVSSEKRRDLIKILHKTLLLIKPGRNALDIYAIHYQPDFLFTSLCSIALFILRHWKKCYTRNKNQAKIGYILSFFFLILTPCAYSLYRFTVARDHTRWRSWLRHCATTREVAGSITDGVTGIFYWYIPSCRILALQSTQLLTKMSTRNISWRVKAAGA